MYQLHLRRLGQRIRDNLRADQAQRAKVLGGGIEALLSSNPPITRESWTRLKFFYCNASDLVPPPLLVTLKAVTQCHT